MQVYPNERRVLARLLKFLELGEHMAHDCALAQATLAPEPSMKRFLLAQAGQEAFHAIAFRRAIEWLGPCSTDADFSLPMERYRKQVEEALRRRDFLETILAEQIILEGLGRATLGRLEEGLVKRGAGFTRLRRLLLQQEEAHHLFGQRTLERALAKGETSLEALCIRTPVYLALTDAMITSLTELFQSIHEDPGAYIADTRIYLPRWLTPHDRTDAAA